MTPIEILEKAKTTLQSGWAKLAMARDRYGNAVDVYAPFARRFCLVGAILRNTPNPNHLGALDLLDADEAFSEIVETVSLAIKPEKASDPLKVITSFNDGFIGESMTMPAKVLKILDKSIEILRQKEGEK